MNEWVAGYSVDCKTRVFIICGTEKDNMKFCFQKGTTLILRKKLVKGFAVEKAKPRLKVDHTIATFRITVCRI